jgi:chromosomal replication initiation ATPase DnaA
MTWIDEIFREVCTYYKADQGRMRKLAKYRREELLTIRRTHSLLCRERGMTFAEIGKFWGKTHKTIMSSCSRAEGFSQTNRQYAIDLREIRNRLQRVPLSYPIFFEILYSDAKYMNWAQFKQKYWGKI